MFLEEEIDTLYHRTRGSDRPLRASTREECQRRYAERLSLYEEVADLKVVVRDRQLTEVAQEIARWLPRA